MRNMILAALLTTLSALVTAPTLAADNAPVVSAGSLTGAFSSWGSTSLEGDWKIVEDAGTHYIELSDNFSAKKGPDVKIFLSPTAASEVTGKNAVKGSVLVQQISNFKGRTRVAIPAGTDLSEFRSLVFHCEAYSKLWGSSPLR